MRLIGSMDFNMAHAHSSIRIVLCILELGLRVRIVEREIWSMLPRTTAKANGKTTRELEKVSCTGSPHRRSILAIGSMGSRADLEHIFCKKGLLRTSF
jgi:hypothetical protein